MSEFISCCVTVMLLAARALQCTGVSCLSLQKRAPYLLGMQCTSSMCIHSMDLRAAWLQPKTGDTWQPPYPVGSGLRDQLSMLCAPASCAPSQHAVCSCGQYMPYHPSSPNVHPSKFTRHPLQAVGASERVFQLLDRAPQMVPAGKAKPSGSPDGGEVQFCNVHFSYPSRPDVQASLLICADVCHIGQHGVPWVGKSCPVLVPCWSCMQANITPCAAVCALTVA